MTFEYAKISQRRSKAYLKPLKIANETEEQWRSLNSIVKF